MAKKHKIEKETRRLIEGISDLVKKKGDRYKFKTKNKKVIKKVKRTCCHWTIRKGKEVPTTVRVPELPGYFKCSICGAVFPIKPPEAENGKSAYSEQSKRMLELVNQIQFLSVRLGGDAEDTKMFLKLREYLPRFNKVANQIIKRVDKREKFEKRKQDGSAMSQFDAYHGFDYRM